MGRTSLLGLRTYGAKAVGGAKSAGYNPIGSPMIPTEDPTQTPTAPVQEETEPTTLPMDSTEPSRPDIAVQDEPKDFSWVIVVIVAVATMGIGFLLSKKKT